MSARVEVVDLHVRLGDTDVLRGVDLHVADGEWVTVVGPNGAGKTTLARCVAGLIRPSRGRVLVMGRELAGMRPHERARAVGLVPQTPLIPPGMAVGDYVLLGRTPFVSPFGAEAPADVEAAASVLERLDLTPMVGRELMTLSGGERQRAVIARTLAQETAVLVLDEPTTALDIGHQIAVLELVDRLRCDLGFAVLSTMHDLTLAGQFADRLVMLSEGTVVAAGPAPVVLSPALVAEHYGTPVSVLSGESGPIVVPVRTTRGDPQ